MKLEIKRCDMSHIITPISSNAIAFIDPRVENYPSLRAGIATGTEIVLLSPVRDGLEQICEVLSQRTDIDRVHIVSDGSPGSLQLGNAEINLKNLERYRDHLEKCFASPAYSAPNSPDLLICACHVAAGPIGLAFIERLSQLTGANIAASL